MGSVYNPLIPDPQKWNFNWLKQYAEHINLGRLNEYNFRTAEYEELLNAKGREPYPWPAAPLKQDVCIGEAAVPAGATVLARYSDGCIVFEGPETVCPPKPKPEFTIPQRIKTAAYLFFGWFWG